MSGIRQRIDVHDAVALIRERMPRWPAESLPLDEAADRILREPVFAERDQPPFDRVTMDGIALRAGVLAAGQRRFFVRGTQPAGTPALALTSDEDCIAVMTGAALPAGADAIVPVERLQRDGDEAVVEEGYAPPGGGFVHRRGSDHPGGSLLLTPGTRLGAPEMAVATLGGTATLTVARRPRIAVAVTGDELVEPGAPIADFQIRCSNDRALLAALRARGHSALTRTHLPDDADVLRREIATLHQDNDLLILSGGVSMGEFDLVPGTLAELGVEAVFHRILQRPGLPMWFGVGSNGKPVFALPGNPVSTLVCLVRYVLPALDEAEGVLPAPEPLPVALADTVRFEPDLAWFLPVHLRPREDGGMEAVPRPTHTSGDFVSLVGTDGFVELPRGRTIFPAGHVAPFYPW